MSSNIGGATGSGLFGAYPNRPYERKLGTIKNKSEVYDIELRPVAAGQNLTRGSIINRLLPFVQQANLAKQTLVETDLADNALIRGSIGMIEADSDNTTGEDGRKVVQIFGHQTIGICRAAGAIDPTKGRRLRVGANGGLVQLKPGEPEAFHIANYLGLPGEDGQVYVKASPATTGQEIEVLIL